VAYHRSVFGSVTESAARCSRQSEVLMSDTPNHKFVDKLRPPCSRCGRLLLLARIEPEEPRLRSPDVLLRIL